MPDAYVKQTWIDGLTGGTPISAARLAHIEDGIDNATLEDNAFVNKTSAAPAVGERGKAKEEQGAAGVADEWYIIRKRKDDGYGTAPILPRLIDIREWGIRGVGDETTLFQEAVDELPQMDHLWGDAGIVWEAGGATGFLFPPRMSMTLSAPIIWPNKVPIIMKAETAWGARINYTGAGACFRPVASSVGMALDVDGMAFNKAAFDLAGSWTGHLRWHNCNFVDTPVYAIDLGAGVQGNGSTFADVTNNHFYRCAGGVSQRVVTNQLLTVRKNRFNAMHAAHVWIDTSSAHIIDNDFQGVNASTIPFIRFGQSNSSGDLVVSINRFGNEEFVTNGVNYFPPEAYILAWDESGSNPVGGVSIRDNEVMTSPTPSATKSRHFIRIKSRPGAWAVDGNRIGKMFGAIVDEAWVADTTVNPYTYSQWGTQHVVQTHVEGSFTHGGVGWRR